MSESIVTFETLRIPRALWADLEETIIQQDRQFLTMVAKELQLPVNEVIRKCLGTSGESKSIPCLLTGEEVEFRCPWYTRNSVTDLVWAPCGRLRMSATSACALHKHSRPGPCCALNSSPTIQSLPTLTPIVYKDALYWALFDKDNKRTIEVFREDFTIEEGLQFVWVTFKEERILSVCVNNT
jgi:hypothetical protein